MMLLFSTDMNIMIQKLITQHGQYDSLQNMNIMILIFITEYWHYVARCLWSINAVNMAVAIVTGDYVNESEHGGI